MQQTCQYPKQNKIDDMYSLLKFLRVAPFDDYQVSLTTMYRLCVRSWQSQFVLLPVRRVGVSWLPLPPIQWWNWVIAKPIVTESSRADVMRFVVMCSCRCTHANDNKQTTTTTTYCFVRLCLFSLGDLTELRSVVCFRLRLPLRRCRYNFRSIDWLPLISLSLFFFFVLLSKMFVVVLAERRSAAPVATTEIASARPGTVFVLDCVCVVFGYC
jgi:hypothetical protein